MFHDSAVSVTLLKVLRERSPSLSAAGFALAGGTSLALRFGHRMSVDLDFFTTEPFDPVTLAAQLATKPGEIIDRSIGSLQLLIQGIKIDCLRHDYPLLDSPTTLDGIRMWSLADVAAMKLNAITNRGSKKDFFDLVVLLDHYTLLEMLDLYCAKYAIANRFMVIRSLAWFDDAESEPDPVTLGENTWPMVKELMSEALAKLS